MVITFSFSPHLHIVEVSIASILGNFLSLPFKLFVFAKTFSVLTGSQSISLPYLLTFAALQRKENVFAMKIPEKKAT